MTAVTISGTADGFIVGADGLQGVPAAEARAKPEAAAHKRTDAQKILPLCSDDRTIAYALAGNVRNDNPAFDAVKECIEASNDFRHRDLADATQLVNRFSKQLVARINHARYLPELEKAPDGSWHHLEDHVCGSIQGFPISHACLGHSLFPVC